MGTSRENRGQDSDWLTPEQVADLIQVSVDVVYDACKRFSSGDKDGLKHRRLSRKLIRIHRAWVNDWMQNGAQAA